MASIDNIRSGQIMTTNSRGPARFDSNSVSDTRNEAKKKQRRARCCFFESTKS